MRNIKNKTFSQDNPYAWRNPWVIAWVSLLAVVVIVNITMISTAFITYPGLVEKDYYEKGQDYEQNINKRISARNALAWTYTLNFPTEPVIHTSSHYSFDLVDKHGIALSNATVVFSAYRPSDVNADFKVNMIETVAGRYEARVSYSLKGVWRYTISIERNADTYSFTQRIHVLVQ
jgi:nitrogen fixation protein FixH